MATAVFSRRMPADCPPPPGFGRQFTWRTRYWALLSPILASMPWPLSRKEARDVLNAAYPAGEREHHPYKIWLSELNRILDWLFPGDALKAGSVAWTFHKEMLWLFLDCGWCNFKARNAQHRGETRGCLVCGPMADELKELTQSQAWRRWKQTVAAEPEEAGNCADWLMENGHESIGLALRRHLMNENT